MKLFAIFAVTLAVVALVSGGPIAKNNRLANAIKSGNTRIMEQEIIDALECFRTVLTAGLPEHNIPSFDPLEMEGFDIDLDALGIEEMQGQLGLHNIVVAETMGFVTTYVKGSLIIIGGFGAEVDVTLLFPKITFSSTYNADLKVAGIEVWGDGTLKAEITNLEIAFHLKARLSDPQPTNRIWLEELEFLPSVENVHIEFTGLFHDEEQSALVNEILNGVATNYVNEKGKDISDLLSGILMDVINNAEPGEPSEEPSLIEIILAECQEEPTTVLPPHMAA